MFRQKKSLLLIAVFVVAMLLVACGAETVEVTRVVKEEVTRVITEEVEIGGEMVEVTRVVTEEVEVTRVVENGGEEDRPVTLNYNLGTEPPTLDPSLGTDNASIDVITNLFVMLTKFHPETGEVQPYLATGWESGEDEEGNQTWTFNLRDDIAWVQHDPSSGETTQVTDEEGNPRFVNAADVVYGVRRTLDPDTASDYAYTLYIVKNGAAVNAGEEGYTLEDIGVEALDETTVQFTLENKAPYFPSIAGLWVAAPMPEWAIAERPQRWIEPGFIVTNGAYVLDTWIHGSELAMLKNPLWVEADDVQIERVEMLMIEEDSTAFALYENDELDTAAIPQAEIDRVKADPVMSEEYYNAAAPCTYYYGFNHQKPPFDNPLVRRAFVYAIDRESLVQNVTKGGQIPATSFAPPGIFGAPQPGEVGLQFDPEAAQASLQEFLDQEGMTLEEFNQSYDILMMHNTGEGHARIAAAIQQMWQDALGVDISIENQEWQVFLDTIEKDTPVEQAPHIYRTAWCADYADENNWVHEVFNSQVGANSLRRNCEDPNCEVIGSSRFDELTVEAQQVEDPAERAELYYEAERILAEEEAAYAPIYHYTTVRVAKPWLNRNYPLLNGIDIFNWTIDWDAKVEATQ